MSIRERRGQRGATLVELIVAMVIIAAAVGGVLVSFDVATRGSADPMLQKQALAIAESLLEEVQLMPFTFCDPDDPQASSATSNAVGPTGCSDAATVEVIGSEGIETRYLATTPFDNVSDYNGFDSAAEAPPGLKSITSNDLGLDGYAATIAVAQEALGPAGSQVPAAESLRITVTVTGPANTSVTLTGYRTRYAPRAVP